MCVLKPYKLVSNLSNNRIQKQKIILETMLSHYFYMHEESLEIVSNLTSLIKRKIWVCNLCSGFKNYIYIYMFNLRTKASPSLPSLSGNSKVNQSAEHLKRQGLFPRVTCWTGSFHPPSNSCGNNLQSQINCWWQIDILLEILILELLHLKTSMP